MPTSKNIPVLLDDHQYFFNLFQKKLKQIDAQAVKLLFHQFFYIKRHVASDFFHYFIEHRLTLELKHGLKIRRKVYAISFSDHGRKKMYQAMVLAYEHKFGQGEAVVPKPLWYEEETMTLFYLGVPGDSLLEHLKNGHLDLDNIKKVAHALKNLHAIKTPKNIFGGHEFSLRHLDPTNILERSYNLGDPLKPEIIKQLAVLNSLKGKIIQEKNVFSHGDFHPDNIIINRFNSSQIVFIDFSEVCLAPPYYDIASFLEQLEFMSLGYLDRRRCRQVENFFLAAYFGDKKLTPELVAKINLYKSLITLKNSVYALIFTDIHERHYAGYLVQLSQALCQKIKQQTI